MRIGTPGLGLLIGLGCFVLSGAKPAQAQGKLGSATLWQKAEQWRIQEQIERVERDLRDADVSQLSPAQQAARARNLDRLHTYHLQGVFPINDRFHHMRVPFFRDSRGTLCAMAYLIEQSGNGDFVDAVARTQNTAYIEELKENPTLQAWLHENGLSVLDAARIQPTYNFEDDKTAYTSDWSINSTVVMTGVSGSSLFLNRRHVGGNKGRNRGLFGIIAGGLTLVLGITHLGDKNSDNQGMAIWNTVLGAATLGLGTVRYQQARQSRERMASLSPLPEDYFTRKTPDPFRPASLFDPRPSLFATLPVSRWETSLSPAPVEELPRVAWGLRGTGLGLCVRF
jgi:hypothetical protein